MKFTSILSVYSEQLTSNKHLNEYFKHLSGERISKKGPKTSIYKIPGKIIHTEMITISFFKENYHGKQDIIKDFIK